MPLLRGLQQVMGMATASSSKSPTPVKKYTAEALAQYAVELKQFRAGMSAVRKQYVEEHKKQTTAAEEVRQQRRADFIARGRAVAEANRSQREARAAARAAAHQERMEKARRDEQARVAARREDEARLTAEKRKYADAVAAFVTTNKLAEKDIDEALVHRVNVAQPVPLIFLKCFLCDVVGHVAKDCPSRCFICMQSGHAAGACPTPESANRVCSHCGKLASEVSTTAECGAQRAKADCGALSTDLTARQRQTVIYRQYQSPISVLQRQQNLNSNPYSSLFRSSLFQPTSPPAAIKVTPESLPSSSPSSTISSSSPSSSTSTTSTLPPPASVSSTFPLPSSASPSLQTSTPSSPSPSPSSSPSSSPSPSSLPPASSSAEDSPQTRSGAPLSWASLKSSLSSPSSPSSPSSSTTTTTTTTTTGSSKPATKKGVNLFTNTKEDK